MPVNEPRGRTQQKAGTGSWQAVVKYPTALWVKKDSTLAHNFPKCWSIFKILSKADSAVNT